MGIYDPPTPSTWAEQGLVHVSAHRFYTYDAMLSAYIDRVEQSRAKHETICVRISETFLARAPLLLLTKMFIDATVGDNPACIKILALDPFSKAAQQRCSTIAGRADGREACSRMARGLSHIVTALKDAKDKNVQRSVAQQLGGVAQRNWRHEVEGIQGSTRELHRLIREQLQIINDDDLVRRNRVVVKFYDNDFFPCSYIVGDILSTPFSLIKTQKTNQNELNGNQLECPFVFWRPVEGPGIPLGRGYEDLFSTAIASYDHRFDEGIPLDKLVGGHIRRLFFKVLKILGLLLSGSASWDLIKHFLFKS